MEEGHALGTGIHRLNVSSVHNSRGWKEKLEERAGRKGGGGGEVV